MQLHKGPCNLGVDLREAYLPGVDMRDCYFGLKTMKGHNKVLYLEPGGMLTDGATLYGSIPDGVTVDGATHLYDEVIIINKITPKKLLPKKLLLNKVLLKKLLPTQLLNDPE